MRIVQAFVAVVPAGLILWMGGTYLADCGRLLLDPGVPVAFALKTPDGTVRFRAEGYRIDLPHHAASAWGLTATRTNGTRIAALRAVSMVVPAPTKPRPVIHAKGLFVRVERDARGIDLTRLFPKQPKPTNPVPFSVTVEGFDAALVDRTLRPALTLRARSKRVRVDGVGDDLRVDGRFAVPGVGTADVRVQGLPDVGTTVDVRSDALRLERIAPRFAPGLRVASLVARGPMRIDLPKKGAVRIASTMRVEARDVRYQKYAADLATFEGKASDKGASGVGFVRVGRVEATFRGTAGLKSGAGQVVASVPSLASLPAFIRALVPAKVDFRDARYEGWVAWRGTGRTAQAQVDGRATVARAVYGPDAVDAVSARVATRDKAVDLRGLTASWRGAPLAGDASFDYGTKRVTAAVVAPRVGLTEIARRLGDTSGLTGTVDGEALVTGTLDRPSVEGRLGGTVALRGRSLGTVEARGAWLAGAARVDRLQVSGPLGAIVAGGTVRPDGTLDFKAEARGLRVERLAPGAQGLVSANLRVGGTLREPKATGRLEAYRLAYAGQTLPAAGFDLSADRRRIDLTLFTAVRGTARVSGRVGAILQGPGVRLADPNTWLVNGGGDLTGIQVAELPSAEGVGDLAGVLAVHGIDVGGRLGDPTVRARLEGQGLIVRGVRIEALTGSVSANRRGATLSGLEVRAAGGRVTGGGTYALATKRGDLDLAVSDLQLSRLLADVSEDVVVEGTVSAPRVRLAVRNGKPFGTAEGTLTAVKANGVLAGDGNWSLDANGDRVKAEASVGRLDPQLRALDASATYDVKAGSLAATVAAKDLPLQAVVAGIEAQRTSSEDEASRFATIRGDLSGTVAAVRTRDGDLRIDASDLRAAAIRYLELDYGTLTAESLKRRGRRWEVAGGRLEGPEGLFLASGAVVEDGELDVKASGERVRPSAFSAFVPTLAQFTGTARFDLAATGPIRKPTVVGTAGADGLLAEGKEALGVDLTSLAVSDGKSSVKGVLRYGDRFGGLLSLATGWRYDEPIRDASFDASAELGRLVLVDPTDPGKGYRVERVALTDVPGLASYLDPSRTSGGTLSGAFAASGTFDAPRLTGGVALRADRVGILVPGPPGRPVTRSDDTLKDLKVDLGFDERNAPRLTASIGFSRGGTLTALATLGDLGKKTLVQTLSETRDWRGLPVAAQLDFGQKTGVTVRQTIAGGTTTATVAGLVTVSGPAATPLVKGRLVASGLEASLPTLAEGSAGSSVPPVDPSFDLKLALADAGRFRTATADLYLDGDVAVRGTLTNPEATAELVTERGSIRLPGGVVRVDKGGQISFVYRNPLAGGAPGSATIDLQGRSQVTLVPPGSTTSQRYDVVLDIQGDLLRENGLRFDATADPPGLGKEEILNALGGTSLVSGIAAGGRGTEAGVRNALAGFALPGLLDPVTGGIAGALRLDYVNVDYNQFDQTTINIGRSLGRDFSFQGRQQVGAPAPGYRSIYDLRLSYNPRRLLPKLSRLSFTLGTDQDRPWKASVEFGTRFGARGHAGDAPKHVLYPAKRP